MMAEKRGNATRRRVLPPSDAVMRRIATNPRLNVWVAANAGSGKTTILRDRVLRLLLSGVLPDHILCITFTKAAAAEMQDRIFKALAEWVGADDAALRVALAHLTGEEADALPIMLLHHARSLFARAVETPGGLKIQTIHAFAERLLHLFPLEAGVPVDFNVLEPGDALALKEQARQDALNAAHAAQEAQEGEGQTQAIALSRAFDIIVAATGLGGFANATRQAIDALTQEANRTGVHPLHSMPFAQHAALFGVEPKQTEAEMMKALLASGPMDAARKAMAGEMFDLATKATSKKTAEALERVTRCTNDAQRIDILTSLYLKQDLGVKAPIKFVTKEIETKAPQIHSFLLAEQERVAQFVEKRKALAAFTRSRAMLVFAADVLSRYTRAKTRHNALDFDDLIARLRLMLLKGSAAWVRMKLDAAIDHILVDEAQDTNPSMWDIVQCLADDFFSGDGQSPRPRSLFVVGDEKQSIYSFQGAEIAEFERVRQHFAAQVSQVIAKQDNRIAAPVPLSYSFRSSPDILRGVDQIFGTKGRVEGVTASGACLQHDAAHENFPGLIEIWPLETSEEAAKPEDPDAPVDAPLPAQPALKLAERIASQIQHWLETGERFAEDGTRIRPGDILILVRERGLFFRAVLRALKLKGIPVAGADRLKLDDEIAVDDLLIIAKAALLPQDDLALATALKTPLFGFDDAALEAIAFRDESIALREVIQRDSSLSALATTWQDLQKRAGQCSPFAFFSALLAEQAYGNVQQTGRQALLTRLGRDAAEALDAFLGECYAWGQSHPPSLAAFMGAREGRSAEIKRDMAAKTDEVRVMTVHGAKGLEGRIVFLADTTTLPDKKKEAAAFLHQAHSGHFLVWAGSKKQEPPLMQEARIEERAKTMAEYRRLLYVALTRAEDRLYIAGYAGQSFKPGDEAEPITLESPWYALVREGLTDAYPVKDARDASRTLWRITAQEATAPLFEMQEATSSAFPHNVPAWLHRKAPEEALPPPPLRPSRAGIMPEWPRGDDAADQKASRAIPARRRGILIHQLYERLPHIAPENRAAIGVELLRLLAPEASVHAAQCLLAPILAFLDSQMGRAFFGADSRAELSLAGNVLLPDGTSCPVSARIDRLIVRENTIEIIDIKTGQPRPLAQADDILRQMALYQALVSQVFPDKIVTASIFWTEQTRIEPIPNALLRDALTTLTAPPHVQPREGA